VTERPRHALRVRYDDDATYDVNMPSRYFTIIDDAWPIVCILATYSIATPTTLNPGATPDSNVTDRGHLSCFVTLRRGRQLVYARKHD
jgi:hypothetical protein